MTKYQLQKDENGKTMAVLKDDMWSIPMVEDNTDYQAYLKWVAEGNTPLPADEPTA